MPTTELNQEDIRRDYELFIKDRARKSKYVSVGDVKSELEDMLVQIHSMLEEISKVEND